MNRVLFSAVLAMLALTTAPVGPSEAMAAPAKPQCDPVWEVAQPIYKKVKGRTVLVGWYCQVRQPNGGPSTGGGHQGGG